MPFDELLLEILNVSCYFIVWPVVGTPILTNQQNGIRQGFEHAHLSQRESSDFSFGDAQSRGSWCTLVGEFEIGWGRFFGKKWEKVGNSWIQISHMIHVCTFWLFNVAIEHGSFI